MVLTRYDPIKGETEFGKYI